MAWRFATAGRRPKHSPRLIHFSGYPVSSSSHGAPGGIRITACQESMMRRDRASVRAWVGCDQAPGEEPAKSSETHQSHCCDTCPYQKRVPIVNVAVTRPD